MLNTAHLQKMFLPNNFIYVFKSVKPASTDLFGHLGAAQQAVNSTLSASNSKTDMVLNTHLHISSIWRDISILSCQKRPILCCWPLLPLFTKIAVIISYRLFNKLITR